MLFLLLVLWTSCFFYRLGAVGLLFLVSPYAGAPAVVIGVVSCFLWSDKVLGEPFGIPANLIGIGLNCLTLFVVHQMMKRRVPSTGIYAPEVL